jgi:membrane protein YdbS with pleckstrin-like domain
MEKNWDPGVKKFFIKILNTIALGLSWIMASAIAGLYFELGYTNGKPVIYTIIFYTLMVISLLLLIRYLYKIWKNG